MADDLCLALLEREHVRVRLERHCRRDALRWELLRRRRADLMSRCGDAGADLLALDAADEQLRELA